MTKTLVATFVAILMSACASVPESNKAEGVTKLSVVQTGTMQNAEHVFCEEDRCPKRTPKYLPLLSPPPKPVVQPAGKPVVEEKPKQVQFKVHFRWGWSRLDDAGRKEVAEVVTSGMLKNAKKIEVAGRTDPTGSRAFNEKLAIRRAQTVKAGVVMAGIPEESITAVAQTPCCDGDKNAAKAVMRELRRTDIDITITTK